MSTINFEYGSSTYDIIKYQQLWVWEQCLYGGRIFTENLMIYSDSQPVIKSSTSALPMNARDFLEKFRIV